MPLNLPLGTKVTDLNPRPRWLDIKLSDKNFAVGDLVTYSSTGYGNHMTIWRIAKDNPAIEDAVVGNVAKYVYTGSPGRRQVPVKEWVLPGKKTRIPDIKLRGYVELVPVFSFFPRYHEGKKNVSYVNLYRLKKLDLLELARNFSNFQDFIKQEVKRLSE
jgi:hypothetical protein